MRYRPKGWRKPGLLDEMINRSHYEQAYEAGADAMLEGLKKEWGSLTSLSMADGTEKPVCFIEAVIPEDE